MNCAINTNISEIPEAKSLFFDTSRMHNDNSTKNRPITSRVNLKSKNYIKYTPQTPKITNYGFTPKYPPKLFSLIDINDKYHSKAPALPNQYKRKIYDNIYNLLYNKNNKGLIFKIPQVEYNINKTSTDLEEKRKNQLKKSRSVEKGNKIEYTMSRKERIYKPVFWDNTSIEEIKKSQRDKLMPAGFELYEKNLFDNNSKNYIKNNYVKINKTNINDNKKNNNKKKDIILIRKLNQMKQYKSNIFFNEKGNNTRNSELSKKILDEKRKILYKKYLDSDIFHLRNEKNIIEKSGEHSFFRANNLKKTIYNSNNETLLGWKLRKPLPSFLNYTSSQFSLFNRDMKNNGKTKEGILNELKKINEKFNPAHKQKGLTEFIELSRVSAPNINVDYNKAINDDPNIFKKKNNISSEFFDIYNHYSSLCDKPFKKFSIISPS